MTTQQKLEMLFQWNMDYKVHSLYKIQFNRIFAESKSWRNHLFRLPSLIFPSKLTDFPFLSSHASLVDDSLFEIKKVIKLWCSLHSTSIALILLFLTWSKFLILLLAPSVFNILLFPPSVTEKATTKKATRKGKRSANRWWEHHK